MLAIVYLFIYEVKPCSGFNVLGILNLVAQVEIFEVQILSYLY